VDLGALKKVLLHLRLWLNEVLLWFAERLGVKMPADVRAELHAEFHEARRTVLMIALVHAAALERGRPRPRYPLRAHAGAVTPQRRGSDFRSFVRGVKIGGRTLRHRYARLRAVIDAFDACVAVFAKRLAGSKMRAPVSVSMVVDIVAALSAPGPVARDSS
jgi:hypothetical protein